MALINCDECNVQLSSSAANCPACGHPNKLSKSLSKTQIFGGIFISAIAAWYFAGGGLEQVGIAETNRISGEVALDQIKQYEIAKRQGDKIQICVQASVVAAGFLQAKDEVNFNHWKQIETKDCEIAGIPH